MAPSPSPPASPLPPPTAAPLLDGAEHCGGQEPVPVAPRKPARGRPRISRGILDVCSGSRAVAKQGTVHVQHRCFISHYLDKIKAIDPRDCHKTLFSKTPFSHFIDIPEMVCGGDFLDSILACHKKGECFEFGGKVVQFTRHDVGLILGLPATGEKIEIRGPVKPSRIGGRFVGEDLTREVIEAKMKELRDLDMIDDVCDFVKLWLLYIFTTFLCPQTKYNCPRNLLWYVDDLEALSNFCWANVVHDAIMHKLPSVAENVKMRNQGKQPKSMGYVLGCTAVLCAWFYEHTTLFDPLYYNARPRFFGWALDHNRRKNYWFNAIRELSPDEVIQNLQPMEDERWILEGNNKSGVREFRLLGREMEKRITREKRSERKRKGWEGEEEKDDMIDMAREEKRKIGEVRKNMRGNHETWEDLVVVGENSEEQHSVSNLLKEVSFLRGRLMEVEQNMKKERLQSLSQVSVLETRIMRLKGLLDERGISYSHLDLDQELVACDANAWGSYDIDCEKDGSDVVDNGDVVNDAVDGGKVEKIVGCKREVRHDAAVEGSSGWRENGL